MPTSDYPHRAVLRRACELFGSQSALAKAIGASEMQVSNWLNRDKSIDSVWCTAIEKATGGQVTRKELRPHDWLRYWPELEETAHA